VFRKNYKAGYSTTVAFFVTDAQTYARNVRLEALALKCFGEEARILDEISSPSQNMETVILEKAPNCSLILKGSNFGMMVTLVLTYAEIPFTHI
jgi:hypothetical protein